MKKNIALMALTGILTLASCGQNNDSVAKADTEAPKAVSLTANPATLASSGGSVALTGSATDNLAVTKVTISGGALAANTVCTVVGTTAVTYTCPSDSLPANTTNADKTYTYMATAYDAAGNPATSNNATVTVRGVTAPTQYKLTVNITGVTGTVPVTITNAAGNVVYTGSLSSGNNISLGAGTYTVAGMAVDGKTAPAQTVTINGADAAVTLTYAAAPTITRTLTIDLVNVASAPITIRDAAGNIVQAYNNIVVADNEVVKGLPAGVYTVTGGNVNGATAPAGNVRVDLTNGDGTAQLVYTAAAVQTVGKIAIELPKTGTDYKVGEVIRVTFNATNLDAAKPVICSLGAGNTATAVVSGNQGYCDLTVKNTTDLNIVVSGTDTAGNTVSDARSIFSSAVAGPAVSLSTDEEYKDVDCALPQENAWQYKADIGQGDYPAGSKYYFVKGKVRVNLDAAVVGDAQPKEIEAWYKTTQASSAEQKLDVLHDDKGYYVMFDSSYGAQVGTSTLSHEGYPTQLWFRVKNVTLASITVVPDNIAPEAINPQVDAVRRKNKDGQIWMAGEIQFGSLNETPEDRPLASDVANGQRAINAGFSHVCYYMVPESAGLADQGGDNPIGLRAFANSIISHAAYTSTDIRSAGNPKNADGSISDVAGNRYYNTSLKTADVVQYPADPTKGWVPNPASTQPGYKNPVNGVSNYKAIPNGKYKVYTLTFDKLGNARPASDPYRVTIDNVGPSIDLPAVPPIKLDADIVDDSPLPFPADAGYVSDYARIRVNFGARTLAGYTRQPDGSYVMNLSGGNGDGDGNAAIGIEGDNNNNLPIAKSIVSCTFQNINLLDVANQGPLGVQTPVEETIRYALYPEVGQDFNTFDKQTNDWYGRFDSNKWQDGEVFAKCNQRVVATYTDARDQLGNYTPAAAIQPGTDRTWNPFKVTVDNIDPTVTITNPDMKGTLTAGQTYRPEAQVSDAISGVRNSFMFWSAQPSFPTANSTNTPAPKLWDTNYDGTRSLNNPVEFMRADGTKNSLGGIDFRLPSFDDQPGAKPDKIGIYGLVIDHAGNATLRSKQYNYDSNVLTAFDESTARTGIYNATSFPTDAAARNILDNNLNKIAGITAADTAADSARVGLAGDTTLEVDAQSITSTSGTLEVPKVYGRFNSIDWQAIRNYMLTPAHDQDNHRFEGDVDVVNGVVTQRGDLLNNVVPTYADNLTTSNTGDPSYLSTNTANRTNADLRSDWNNFLAPWMTLSGITNTPDANGRYKMTNSLLNPLVTGNSTTYPQNCDPVGNVVPFAKTYCTPFSKYYDQMNAIFTAGDGDFIFTGRNIQK